MAWGVAVSPDGFDTGYQYAALDEGIPLAAGDVWGGDVASHLEIGLKFSWGTASSLLRQPEVVVLS